MKRNCTIFFGILALAYLVPAAALAETWQLTWDPVTTYTDGTAFEAGKTVTYTAYWTTDSTLSAASLRNIASSVSTTSTSFDPIVAGMTRGQTVYFTAKSILNSGEQSALSAAFTWVVPNKNPGAPANMRIIKIN